MNVLVTKRSAKKPPLDEGPRPASPYRKPGRPTFTPTQVQIGWVRCAAMLDLPQDFIVREIPGGPISVNTLKKCFGDTIRFAEVYAINQVSMSLYRAAVTPGPGQVRAGIFILKSVGWPDDDYKTPPKKRLRKKQNQRSSSKAKPPDGGPPPRARRIKLSRSEVPPRLSSADEIERLKKLLRKS